MKASTPRTERPPSTLLRKAVFGGSLLFFVVVPMMPGAVAQPPTGANYSMHPQLKDVLRERSVPLREVLRDVDVFDAATTGFAPGTTVSIRFFSESNHTLQITETKMKTAARSTSSGTIDGIKGSHFILSRNAGKVSGWFSFPAGQTYVLRPVAGGLTRVVEVDASAGWVCGDERSSVRPQEVMSRSLALTKSTSLPENALAAAAATNPAQPAKIDVLFVYTPAVLAAAGTADALAGQIDLLVESANLCFSNSQINALVNLVHEQETLFAETGSFPTDIRVLVDPTDGLFDDVHVLRDHIEPILFACSSPTMTLEASPN